MPTACAFTESVEALTGMAGFPLCSRSTICAPLVSLPCCLPCFLRVLFPWGALFLAILALGKWLIEHKSRYWVTYSSLDLGLEAWCALPFAAPKAGFPCHRWGWKGP